MVSMKEIEKQLQKIGFNPNAWGRTEVRELHNIILPDEEIYECVNGIYDGGFALLVATNLRVLLVDKKPLNYLTVEDLRFDMINELDYSHRLVGASISISAGNKNLRFTSINQPRLRMLIGHVQRRMAEVKQVESNHREDQVQHLEQINQQLQSYLVAQYEQQKNLTETLQKAQTNPRVLATTPEPAPVRPNHQLADYLFAQRLLAQHQASTGQPLSDLVQVPSQPPPAHQQVFDDLYAEGRQEIFGKRGRVHNIEINPLHIAYAKLPQILWSRFRRPLLTKVKPSQGAVSPSSLPTKV